MSKITDKCPKSFLGLFRHKIKEEKMIIGQVRKDGKPFFTCTRCNAIWFEQEKK